MASFKTEINEVLTALKIIRNELRELKETTAMSTENISNIHQITSDLSRKLDEIVNVTGIKQPVVPVKKEPKKALEQKTSDLGTPKPKPKPKPRSKATKEKTVEKKKKKYGNIMTYFRSKFNTDPGYFYSVMNKEDTEALFTEHEKDLKSKKGDKKIKAQILLLYKAISSNKVKENAMRNMMDKENDEHLKSEGVEASKDETDEEEESESGSDSDHDE
jgi:hypothetical protein